MSYSTSSHAATAYREREILTASPARLVVIVFDHVLANLKRAATASSLNNVAVRREALFRAREGITELLATLDVEKGGSLGLNLRSIYGFALLELMDEARRPDAVRLTRVTSIISELRDAFAAIAATPATATARVPAA